MMIIINHRQKYELFAYDKRHKTKKRIRLTPFSATSAAFV
ncbi:hypothetical protein GCWU000325_00760 [Alloprevotella tannerae ATCC 51259]|uniref:Uncharacterized protein n=1 Tax=Alloprevotella tannerae ATCC 51259 TaxID=626522 RepID=C9LEX9_9BACT|nr:hypothetical protein GCWU000325_00760 [Alloprevotella tannerae ATCC 51259]